jgi:predicted Zn-dependent protease
MSPNDPIVEALREALGLHPDNVPLRKHLADLLMASGRYEEAEKEYRVVLAHTPEDEQSKLSLAEAFCQQQKGTVALVILERMMAGANPPPGCSFCPRARTCKRARWSRRRMPTVAR